MVVTNYAFIQLPKRLIAIDSLKELSKKFPKIEIRSKDSKGLKNPYLIRVKPYIHVPIQEYMGVVACCDKFKGQSELLTGVSSKIHSNYINYKTVLELQRESERLKINLSIPKSWIKKIKENEI